MHAHTYTHTHTVNECVGACSLSSTGVLMTATSQAAGGDEDLEILIVSFLSNNSAAGGEERPQLQLHVIEGSCAVYPSVTWCCPTAIWHTSLQ